MIYQFSLVNPKSDNGVEIVVVQGKDYNNILERLLKYCQSKGREDFFFRGAKSQPINVKAGIISSTLEPNCDS